jgi:hypothetical protein
MHKVYAVCKCPDDSAIRGAVQWPDGHQNHATPARTGVGSERKQWIYSPITAQRKPIMMKKPLKRAIRPIPP